MWGKGDLMLNSHETLLKVLFKEGENSCEHVTYELKKGIFFILAISMESEN